MQKTVCHLRNLFASGFKAQEEKKGGSKECLKTLDLVLKLRPIDLVFSIFLLECQ